MTGAIVDCHLHIVDPARFPIVPGAGYTPRPDESGTREAFDAVLEASGIERALLVQPSCYAFDNRAMLDAVAAHPARFKAIAVIRGDEADSDLEDLGRGGVVGVRFNLASFDPAALAGALAPRPLARLKELGWFAQVHAHDEQWAALAPLLRQSGVRILADHFGMTDLARGLDSPGFRAVLDLGRTGRATVKLSAPFRLASGENRYAALDGVVEALVGAFGRRQCIWGSDWPFLALPKGLDHRQALAALDRWFPEREERDEILCTNPARLFGFGR